MNGSRKFSTTLPKKGKEKMERGDLADVLESAKKFSAAFSKKGKGDIEGENFAGVLEEAKKKK